MSTTAIRPRRYVNQELGPVLTCVRCGNHGTRAFVAETRSVGPTCTAVTACYARRLA